MVRCRSSARESKEQVLATSSVFSLVWFTSFHLHESQKTKNESLKDGKISIHESRKKSKINGILKNAIFRKHYKKKTKDIQDLGRASHPPPAVYEGPSSHKRRVWGAGGLDPPPPPRDFAELNCCNYTS